MKRIKYLLLGVIVLFTFNVKAADDDCEKAEFNRLKELAKKIEFDYDYKLVDGKAVFSINAVNLNDELKVIDDYDKNPYNNIYKEFKYNNTHKATVDDYEPGKSVTITIKGYVPNFCSGKEVLKKIIKLPYYNYYYNEEKCKGNEDFKYCKVLIDSNISEKEFNRQFELFLKNKEEQQGGSTIAQDNGNKIYIIIGAGVLLVVIMVVIVSRISKKRKKNRL